MMTLKWLSPHMNLHPQSSWIISMSLVHIILVKTAVLTTV